MVTHDSAIAAGADRIVRLVRRPGRRRLIRADWNCFCHRCLQPDRHTVGGSRFRMALKVYINGKLYERKTPRSASTITACSTATACSRACAATAAGCFAWSEHSTGCGIRPRRSRLEIPMSREAMAKAVERHARDQRHRRRLYPPDRHARGRQLGLDPNRTSNPQVIIITDQISLYPQELYRNGLEIVTASTIAQPSRGAQPADQVAQLSEQHPGQDRRAAGRLHRGPDAQPQGRSGRVHRRQHLSGARRRAARRRRTMPAFWKGSPARR